MLSITPRHVCIMCVVCVVSQDIAPEQLGHAFTGGYKQTAVFPLILSVSPFVSDHGSRALLGSRGGEKGGEGGGGVSPLPFADTLSRAASLSSWTPRWPSPWLQRDSRILGPDDEGQRKSAREAWEGIGSAHQLCGKSWSLCVCVDA